MVVGYGCLLMRVKGAIIFKWETTLIIMCMHMQTVAIIGSLRLAWPPAVESTFNWFGLAAFQLPAVKPECLIGAGEKGMFFLMSASKLGLLVSMHLLLIGLRAGFTLLKRPGKADRVFVLHSFLYVLSYVSRSTSPPSQLLVHWRRRREHHRRRLRAHRPQRHDHLEQVHAAHAAPP